MIDGENQDFKKCLACLISLVKKTKLLVHVLLNQSEKIIEMLQ